MGFSITYEKTNVNLVYPTQPSGFQDFDKVKQEENCVQFRSVVYVTPIFYFATVFFLNIIIHVGHNKQL